MPMGSHNDDERLDARRRFPMELGSSHDLCKIVR
jgi:hypothetical protein